MKNLRYLALLFRLASAHSIFQELYVNGVSQGHLNGIRVPDYDGPITDVTSNDVICNGGINPYHTPMSTAIISTPAGATLTAEWHHSLDGAVAGDPDDPIATSHLGPVMAYLAKVPSATQTTVTGLQWFKIWQDGFDPATNTWGVNRLLANKGKVSFAIPSCIAAGQYLLRVEVIALHGASVYPGAQLYMECAQLAITGGGSTSPATVSFPGAYKGTDPGITINIYYPVVTSYTIPGPAVFSCSAGNSTATTTSKTVTSTTVTSSKTTTSTSTAATSSPTGTVAQYGQCGGSTYTGPTVCVAPFKCVVSSTFYSQCL